MGSSQSDTAPRHAYPHLFFALLALTILAPLATADLALRLVYSVLTVAVLIAMVRLTWFQSRIRPMTVALAVVATIASALGAVAPNSLVHTFLLVFMAAFFIVVIVRLLHKVVADRVITADTLYAGACIYLFIGFTWALIYSILSQLQPDTLYYTNTSRPADIIGGWPSYVYFSFTTLSTVGYGDITPATQLARSVVILEMISGVFFVAMLIGRLVDLYRPSSK